jgi:hypothetical protein
VVTSRVLNWSINLISNPKPRRESQSYTSQHYVPFEKCQSNIAKPFYIILKKCFTNWHTNVDVLKHNKCSEHKTTILFRNGQDFRPTNLLLVCLCHMILTSDNNKQFTSGISNLGSYRNYNRIKFNLDQNPFYACYRNVGNYSRCCYCFCCCCLALFSLWAKLISRLQLVYTPTRTPTFQKMRTSLRNNRASHYILW